MRIFAFFLLMSVVLNIIGFLRFGWPGFIAGDLALSILVVLGVLLQPMLFVFGAWYVRVRIPFDSVNARKRRWRVLFVYSSSILLICFLIARSSHRLGTATGELSPSLALMLAYGFYVLIPLLALAVLTSLVAWLVTKFDSASVA